MNYYYLDSNDKPVGPKTIQELAQLASNGTIHEQTKIVAEGDSEWLEYWRVRQATAPTIKPNESRTRFSAFNFTRGIVRVILKWFTLPAQVLGDSARQLSKWGETGRLPTEDSDVPVLTFGNVIMKPVIHWLVFVSFLCPAIIYPFLPGLFFQQFLVALSIVMAGYMIQPFISLFFELGSLGVHIANDIKRMSHRN